MFALAENNHITIKPIMRKLSTNRLLLTAASALPALAMAQQAQRPNIMLIVVDDMGYSDLQCFGGEVQSPSLNSLAEDGSRFTQFFNCGRSCPSRASLLTGCYPHEVGITGMGLSLTRNCVTVAEALKNAGYHTGMSGKWHLSRTQGIGNNNDQMLWLSHQGFFDRPFSDINTYPCNRGFDEHWGTIWGVSDHFDPFSLVHNEQPVFTDGIPDGFYYADFVADKAIDMLDDYAKDDDPFFMYVAFQEPHWPVQAKQSDIDKYKGVYDDGWDALRQRRYDKMVEMGLIDPAQTPNAPNMSNRPWNNESNKAWQSANMEVHAAMVDCVDQNIGRIIAELKAKGMYENTLIVFSSDNGASSENYNIGDFDRHNMTRDGEMVIHDAAVPGGQLSYNYLGTGWAGAVNTPFRYWKTQSFHGGVAAPTIIKWPESMHAEKNTIVNEPCNFIDFMPTCLDVAGAAYPTTYNGNKIQPIADEARSLVPMAKAGAKWDTERIMFWEHENGKAVRTPDWRLTMHTNGNGGWQLFDMHNDYSETTNVASEHPEVVKDLRRKWNVWAKSVGLSVPEELPETPKSLVFHYPFDENLDDASDNNYELTPSTSDLFFDEGKFGACLLLDGTGQYLDFNHTGIVNTSNTQTTFCAWVYSDNESAPNASNASADGVYYRDQIILAQKDNAGTGRLYLYTRAETPTTGGESRFFYDNFIGGNHNHANYGSMKPGEWQHVAVVCDPVEHNVTYYINGERDCTVSVSNFEACTGGFRIGGHKANKDYFEGMIDEAYLFKGVLSADEIRQVMNNNLDMSQWGNNQGGGDDNPPADNKWVLDGKFYTIRNFSSTPAYMQDNDDVDYYIQCGGTVNDNSYWTFEKTANANCYYVKNATTNRYIQGYGPQAQTPVLLGEEKAEYYVFAPSAEGGRYGFSYTGNTPFDFTAGTIGLNLKAESNQDGCLVQTFAAANGTNHRSFWTLDEIDQSTLGISSLALPYTNRIYDLQGRQLRSITHPGLYIVNGRKVVIQ